MESGSVGLECGKMAWVSGNVAGVFAEPALWELAESATVESATGTAPGTAWSTATVAALSASVAAQGLVASGHVGWSLVDGCGG